LGGLAALAALLLLFLLKRKKNQGDQGEVDETMTVETTSMDDDEIYISQYGLSDGVRPIDGDDDYEDLPQAAPSDEPYNEEFENASEHNPEDLEGVPLDPDES
jgi:hypothetical protein